MKIAVEGCCHGELDKIYETLAFLENKENIKVDLLLICGDFQAVRNRSDLQTMAVPPKFQKMNTFYKYYSGEKVAPLLTVFIGGNHEASNYLQELPYGGWVAPNIYYLGYAGVVQFGGIRIAGMSGIFKDKDYSRGHFEHPPYDEGTKRSCYHVRNIDVFRLKQVQEPIDIFLSHDWPQSIYNYGNTQALLRQKKFFRAEVMSDTLGSPAAKELLFKLKPDYWFSAHLHCKFAAVVSHQSESGTSKVTRFLSLDKCLPSRQFLQVLDITPRNADQPKRLHLDPEWLCILKSTNHLMQLTRAYCFLPGPGSNERFNFHVNAEELKSLGEDFGNNFLIPENFVRTAPIYQPSQAKSRDSTAHPEMYINPQTELICEMLGIVNPFAVFLGKPSESNQSTFEAEDIPDNNSNIVDNSDFINSTMERSVNPDEILLDDSDSEDSVVPELPNLGEPIKLSLEDDLSERPAKKRSISPTFSFVDTPCQNAPVTSCDVNTSTPSPLVVTALVMDSTSSPSPLVVTALDSTSTLSPLVVTALDSTSTPISSSGVSRVLKRRNQSMYLSEDGST